MDSVAASAGDVWAIAVKISMSRAETFESLMNETRSMFGYASSQIEPFVSTKFPRLLAQQFGIRGHLVRIAAECALGGNRPVENVMAVGLKGVG